MEDIFNLHNVNFLLYADYSQIYIVCENVKDVTGFLEACLDEVGD